MHNTPLRAIIIDDEKKGINTLRLLLEKFVEDVKIVAESTKARAAIELIENYKPEIVFLDINMPEMDGFALLEKLSWKKFSLIFVTAHHEYALKALKNNALDYILKPIDYRDLRIAVDKVKEQMISSSNKYSLDNYAKLLNELNQQSRNRIVVNLKEGIEPIDASDILFLESRSNYTHLHMSDSRVILTSKTLKEFEDRLCDDKLNFMRVHKSFVVNLKKIVRFHKSSESIVMANDCKIPLAKSRKDEFYAWLNI